MTDQDKKLIAINEQTVSRINREIALADNESVIENLTVKRDRIEDQNRKIKEKYTNGDASKAIGIGIL